MILDLRIGLFLVSFIEPDLDDDLSLKIFAAHYGHELLHVLDETDVVKNWLPPKALADPFVEQDAGEAGAFHLRDAVPDDRRGGEGVPREDHRHDA